MNKVPCPTCNASGSHPNNPGLACPLCLGAGQVESSDERQPWAYIFIPINVSTSGQVPANGTSIATKQISAESDFEWVFTMAVATAITQLTVLFFDQTSGIKFMSDPINLSLWAGTGQLPFTAWVGGQPYTFGAMTSLEMDFTDFSGSNQNNVQVVLWGFKILRKAQGANTTDATQTK